MGVIDFNLPNSGEIPKGVATIDDFEGRWSAIEPVPARRRANVEEAVRAESVAASCRLAGIQITEAEVLEILEGHSQSHSTQDVREVLGYAAAWSQPLPLSGQLLDSRTVRTLHARMMGALGEEVNPTPWRTRPLHPEEFDGEHKATGRVFSTLPPRLVEGKTEELLTWLELELRTPERHPVLVIGAFLLALLSVSPFERGNARLMRLLAGHLLKRAGYSYLPYASLESMMETMRRPYYEALDRSQARLWTDEADLRPWLEFCLQVLNRHRARVEAEFDVEQPASLHSPLQQAILDTVRENGSVDAATLIKATGANRNTLKDNLRKLVKFGELDRTGEKRGTRYSMPLAHAASRTAPSRRVTDRSRE